MESGRWLVAGGKDRGQVGGGKWQVSGGTYSRSPCVLNHLVDFKLYMSETRTVDAILNSSSKI